MSKTRTIDLRELQTVVNRLLDHLIKSKGIEAVPLAHTLYWNISTEELYDVVNPPKQPDIGSLADDWDFIRKLNDPSTEPVTIQLTEVAPILRYIGEVVKEA